MVIESSQHLMQHIDNGGLLSVDDHGRLQEQSCAGRVFQNIGDAFRRWSASGRASIDERNNRLGNAMHAMVARDNLLPNLAEEALPQGGALSTGGRNMLARMEIGRQLSNFPSDARPAVKRELENVYTNLGPTSSTGILKSIEEKAKELLNTPNGRLFIHNHAMAEKISTGNAEVTEAINRGTAKVLHVMRGLGKLDVHDVSRVMENQIRSSRTKVMPKMLEDMAERTGRKILVKNLIRGYIDGIYGKVDLTPERKNGLLGAVMESPQAEGLLEASTPRSADDREFNLKQYAYRFLGDHKHWDYGNQE